MFNSLVAIILTGFSNSEIEHISIQLLILIRDVGFVVSKNEIEDLLDVAKGRNKKIELLFLNMQPSIFEEIIGLSSKFYRNAILKYRINSKLVITNYSDITKKKKVIIYFDFKGEK